MKQGLLALGLAAILLGLIAPQAPADPGAHLSFSPTSGDASTLVIMSGSGFGSNERVTVNGVVGGNYDTDATGSFSGQSYVQLVPAGRYTITAVGLTSGLTDSKDFTVTCKKIQKLGCLP